MDSKSLAHPAQPSTDSREARSIRLFEQRGDEIEHISGWRWSVPLCSGEHRYIADLRHQSCQCPDYRRRQLPCKHIAASTIARAKSGECAGCRKRYRRRDMVTVQESIQYFEGDELCRECFHASDAVVL